MSDDSSKAWNEVLTQARARTDEAVAAFLEKIPTVDPIRLDALLSSNGRLLVERTGFLPTAQQVLSSDVRQAEAKQAASSAQVLVEKVDLFFWPNPDELKQDQIWKRRSWVANRVSQAAWALANRDEFLYSKAYDFYTIDWRIVVGPVHPDDPEFDLTDNERVVMWGLAANLKGTPLDKLADFARGVMA